MPFLSPKSQWATYYPTSEWQYPRCFFKAAPSSIRINKTMRGSQGLCNVKYLSFTLPVYSVYLGVNFPVVLIFLDLCLCQVLYIRWLIYQPLDHVETILIISRQVFLWSLKAVIGTKTGDLYFRNPPECLELLIGYLVNHFAQLCSCRLMRPYLVPFSLKVF